MREFDSRHVFLNTECARQQMFEYCVDRFIMKLHHKRISNDGNNFFFLEKEEQRQSD